MRWGVYHWPQTPKKLGQGLLQNRERTGVPTRAARVGGGSDRIQALNHVLQVLLPAKPSIAG